MTNYNFIGIGINRYQYLQPLTFAQADIEGLDRFFCEEARVHPSKTLCFTDNSPWVDERATYPTRKNLLSWINNGFHSSASPQGSKGSSVLWFAFSGYALQCDGEDYLMPADAKLTDPKGTGIAVREVFAALRKQGAGKIIALMDMNRSTAVIGNGEVGEHTLDLANEMGIATVLSCKPEEFSHETSAIGHGMFTASVLEALRFHRSNLTLDLLNEYLGDRLKELSEHHWRPVQTPIMVIPSLAAGGELVIPSGDITKIDWKTSVPLGAAAVGIAATAKKDVELPAFSNGHSHSNNIQMGGDDGLGDIPETPVDVLADDLEDYPYANSEEDMALHNFDDEPINESSIFVDDEENDIDPTVPVMMPDHGSASSRKPEKKPWYLAGWQWLALLLLLLFGGLGWQFFKGNDFDFASLSIPGLLGGGDDDSGAIADGSDAGADGLTGENPDGTIDSENAGADGTGNNGDDSGATTASGSGDADATSQDASADNAAGDGSAANTDGSAATPDLPNQNADSANGTDATGNSGNGSDGVASGDGSAANTGNPDAAGANGNAGNGTAGDASNTSTANAGNSGATGDAGANGTSGNGAAGVAANGNSATNGAAGNGVTNGSSASNASSGGNSASNATSGNGNGSASGSGDTAGNSGSAAGQNNLAASNPSVLIENGKAVQAQNESILTQANLVLRSSQASSFNDAISAARSVKPGTPLYNEARIQINRWSRVILDIAEARALKGDISGAIAAAKLVPADVPQVYGLATNAIKKWEPQLASVEKNRQIIVDAKELLIPNQASSYSRGISLLKTIQPNEPIFQEGRVLQDQWSRTIYLLANSRAAQGNYPLAVETAKLVPADSPSYKSSLGAIARWQKGVR